MSNVLEELLAMEAVADEATVAIGRKAVTVQGILDPTRISKLFREGQGRAHLPIETPAGEKTRIEEAEAVAYTFLAAGWKHEPRPTYEQIATISRKTGLDCLTAGQKVMELSGLGQEAVDEAKND